MVLCANSCRLIVRAHRILAPHCSLSSVKNMSSGMNQRFGRFPMQRKDQQQSSGNQAAGPAYTHFLSLPLYKRASMEVPLEDLQRRIMRLGIRDVEPSIFIDFETLHLTLGMLSLPTRSAQNEAAALLEQLRSQIQTQAESAVMSVHVRGLSSMQDNTARANVLYFQVAENKPLYDICVFVRNEFIRAGLQTETRDLTFHATFINTRHRHNARRRIPIDANPILRLYRDVDLGQVPLDELHISALVGEKDAHTGYYPCLARVPLKADGQGNQK